MQNNTSPEEVYSKEFKIPFFLYFLFLIEDRMPCVIEHSRKYKVQIKVSVFGKYSFYYTVRSATKGILIMNNKEII